MKALLISIDTLRADHLGCYGYCRPTSPAIDAIAKDGVLFENFYSQCHWTIPSFATIFTGLYPINNLMAASNMEIPTFTQQLPDEIPTLPELLRAEGGATVAIDNLMDFRNHYSCFGRGYMYYVNPSRPPSFGCAGLKAEHATERALGWLKVHANEPFFMHLHYWDPHQKYAPPEEDLKAATTAPLEHKQAVTGEDYIARCGLAGEIGEHERDQIDLYDGEIRHADRNVGEIVRLLKRKRVYKDTLIIVVSDHGELMAEEKRGFCHYTAREGLVRVPLIVKAPGNRSAGKRVPALAQQIDITPTVLDYWGVKPNVEFDGKSVRALIEGRTKKHHEWIFTFGNWLDDLRCRAITGKKWKLIKNYLGVHEGFPARRHRPLSQMPDRELYDLENDPEELRNLADAEPEMANDLEAKLYQWIVKQVGEPARDPLLRKWGKSKE